MKVFTPFILASSVSLFALSNSDKVVNVINRDGFSIGTMTLSQAAKGTRIALDLKDLPPGELAIHFHEKGECLGPEFKTAGEHFSPSKKAHGHKSKDGPHAGDMKNVTVASNGTVKTDFINPYVSLKEGDTALMKAGGTAFVIHAKADDYKTQPSGDSGDRIACAVIK